MNEFEARDYILGKKVESPEELAELAKEICEKFNFDYGVVPRSIGAFLVVAANYFCHEMGVTGFQAGFIMYDFIRGFMYPHNKCGIRVVDYDELLYPQYIEKHTTIPESVWNNIMREAKTKLDEDKVYCHPCVVQYWQDVSKGIVPKEIRIKKDD